MRVNADGNSQHHWRLHFEKCPTILLDGKPIEQVIMADDELGVVEVFLIVNGKVVHDDKNFTTKTLHGRVQIIAPAPGRH